MSNLIWRLRDNGKNSAWPLYDQAADRIEQLERENEELAAHLERYNKAALDAIPMLSGGEVKANLRDVYDQSPQASLAEVRANQAEKSFLSGCNHGSAQLRKSWGEAVNQHAQQIRNGDE